jgi:hypothetical protein
MDDLRRDNALAKTENDRLRRELNLVKSELEAAKSDSRDKYLESNELSCEIKHVVRECSSQVQLYAKRESELLLMYDRLKRENHRLRIHIQSFEDRQTQRGVSLEVPNANCKTTLTISHQLFDDSEKYPDQYPCKESQEYLESISQSQRIDRSLFSPTSILEGLRIDTDCGSSAS